MTRRGLFLDLDGTVADSLGVMRQSYRRFLAYFGKRADEGEFDRLNGPPLASVVADLAATHALGQPVDRLTALYWRLIAEAYQSVEPMPGALALLTAAHKRGMAVAVVTSNSTALTLAWLMRVGFAGHIQTVVGGEDVRCGKPAPEPYLLALARTGCMADRSLAVEDSALGVQAAAAAGLAVCHLGTAETPDLLAVIGRLGAMGDERT